MRRFVAFVVVLVTAAAMLGAYPATARAGDLVPFKGSTEYVLVPGDPTETSHVFVGTGVATHTGRSRTFATVVPHRDAPHPYYSVDATITAANGDKIIVSGMAFFTSLDLTTGTATATGAVDITGGTGRFDGATGTIYIDDKFTLDAHGNVIADDQTLEGSISF